MARIRYFDFRAPDATLSLNEWRRGILQPGVYFGYNCVPGSGGLALTLEMDVDPDKPGAFLGTIITRDAVTIQETEDLDDVVTLAAADPVNPRIDLLVATYIYNAGLPNNDVTYEVVTGTPAAAPVAPAITDNQLILAQINVAPLQVTITADDIQDVNRRNLYGTGVLDSIDSILRPGFYTGFLCKEGTTDDDTTVEAGVFLTKELKRKELAATQVDLFTHSSTSGATFYRYDRIVAMHKFEDIEGNDVDYILVEGAEADESADAVATPPSDGDVLTAAAAVDPKYTSTDYINDVCLVRVQGTAGSMTKDYIHSPRLLLDTHWYVSGGTLTENTQPLGPVNQFFPYQGPQGLSTALNLLQALVNNFYSGLEQTEVDGSPIKLWVDGNFKLTPDELFGIPSFVSIEGVGGAKFIAPEATHPVFALGHSVDTNIAGTLNQTIATDQSGVPGGFERWEFDLDAGAALGSFLGLSDYLIRARFCGSATNGDPMYFEDNGVFREGWFEEYTTADLADTDHSFRAILPLAATGTFDRLVIFKQNAGLRNVGVTVKNPTFAAGNYVSAVGCKNCVIDNVLAPAIETSANNEQTLMRNVRVDGASGDWQCVDDAALPYPNIGGNTYERIFIRPRGAVTLNVGRHPSGTLGERNADVQALHVDMALAGSCILDVYLESSTIHRMTQKDADDVLSVYGDYNAFTGIVMHNPAGGSASELTVEGNDNFFGSISGDMGPLVNWVGEGNTVGILQGNDPEVTFDSDAARRNYVLGPQYIEEGFPGTAVVGGTALQGDEDRNLIIATDAQFSWDAGTDTLTFDNDLFVDLPYVDGRMQIEAAESPLTITDGDRVVVTLDRDVTTDTVVATATVAKASSESLRGIDSFILVRRIGTSLYWATGAIFPDGVTGSLSNAVPLDNSVTHPKLAASAKQFINDCFNAHFGVNTAAPISGVAPAVIFDEGVLDALGAWSMNVGTGELTNGSISGGQLALIQPGDAFIDVDGNKFWIQEVLGNGVRLKPGCDPNVTTSLPQHDFNIVRGGGIYQSDDSYTVTPATIGDNLSWNITFSQGFVPSYINGLYIFIDANGDEFRIISVTAGSGLIRVEGFNEPAAYGGGSLQLRVRSNNNPYNLSLMDLKPSIGAEVVHWADARRTMFHQDSFRGAGKYAGQNLSEILLTTSRQNDKRFRGFGLIGSDLYATGEYDIVTDTESIIPASNTPESASGIEFTAWCTGFSLIAGGAFPIGIQGIQIDGRNVPLDEADSDTRDVEGSSFGWTGFGAVQMFNLEPGVHHVTVLNQGEGPMKIAGVAIFNEHNPAEDTFRQAAGRLYADMTAWDHDVQDIPFPTLGPRGGRIARYIPSSDYSTQAWAVADLDARSETGDTSTVSPTITSIATPTDFKVGDIVRIVYAASSEKRRVTAVGASSIDVVPNPGTTQVGATIEYAGRTAMATTTVVAEHEMDHRNEEEIMTVPFYGLQMSGFMDVDQAWMGHENATPVRDRATMLPDNHQYVVAEAVAFRPTEPVMEITSSSTLRIGFIGTGLDLAWSMISANSSTPDLDETITDVSVDGVSYGSVRFSHFYGEGSPAILPMKTSLSTDRDIVWFNMVQELDYGFHVIEFDFTGLGATWDLWGYSVWGPPEPSFDGVKTWESCFLGQPARAAGVIVDDSDGATNHHPPSGFLSFFAGAQFYAADPTAGVGWDPQFLFANSVVDAATYERGIYHSQLDAFAAAGPGDDHLLKWVFYGSSFGVEIAASAAGCNYTLQLFNPESGAFEDASVIGMVSLSGSATTGAVPTSRTRLFWEFQDPNSGPIDKVYLVSLAFDNNGGSAGTDVVFYGSWSRTTFHFWQRRDMIGGGANALNTAKRGGWLVERSHGRDARVLKAADIYDPPPGFNYSFTTQHSLADGTGNPTDTPRFLTGLVYSEGGFHTVEFTANITDTNLADIGIDLLFESGPPSINYGDAATPGTQFRRDRARWTHIADMPTLSAPNTIHLKLRVWLPPGLHLFTMYLVDATGDDFDTTSSIYLSNYGFFIEPESKGDYMRPQEATLPFIRGSNLTP